MTKMQTRRAQKVVDHFKQVLSPSGRKAVSETHFEELALMVESAIEAAILEEVAGYAHRLEEVIEEMKHNAAIFDETSALAKQQVRQ
jgi:hypothetical protein